MATTPVRWFHSGMANAPVLSGTAGALVALLDACLIDGFDSRSINSISVASGVATVTISAGHVFDVHAVIRVAGVTGALAALNDDWRVATATGSTLTFPCPGIADGSATGTMIAKRSPAGWAKPFSATNKAVYQSQNLAATRLYIRVDDSAAQLAPIRGYESMTSVDAGSNLFPTIAQVADATCTWRKSNVASSAARAWSLYADDAAFYFLPEYHSTYPGLPPLYGFGDLVKLASADAYHAFILGCATGTGSTDPTSGTSSRLVSGASTEGCYLARAASQAVGAIAYGRVGSRITDYFGAAVPAISTSVDGNVHLHGPVLALDGTAISTAPIRGRQPGVLQPLQQSPATHRAVIDGNGDLSGRAIMFNNMVATSTSTFGCIAFDITGPWR
ncbi:hypothetical protein LLG90_13370 [Aromatoleum toluclasticum]|uniref:hypothetical protein n=1 Tax=Aromatoleum toluclasticum TaxID=92003 RepID=UPI001D185A58|nr:hypothetical protein [Aromatoleum toluclasticum]MCC4116344.1 hypothetical protein [Aromatoleum toluclasticum]